MIIHNISNLPTLDYRKVTPFQGDLKDLTDANHDKLLTTLKKRGFTAPLHVWRDTDDVLYLLDGHQRQRVLTTHKLNDHGSYMVPYVEIPAANAKEAHEILLELTSQYGTITPDGFDTYLELSGLSMVDLEVNFDAIKMDQFVDELGEVETEKPKGVKKYSTDELRNIAKSYYPADLQTITGFLAVVDDR